MKYFFSGHAFKKMIERGFSPTDIKTVIEQGHVIQEYPDDTPYPSRLFLGFVRDRPVHVVSAYDDLGDREVIVTVYEPDPDLWLADFTKRK